MQISVKQWFFLVVSTCNPSIQEAEEDLRFEASLGYTVNQEKPGPQGETSYLKTTKQSFESLGKGLTPDSEGKAFFLLLLF